MKLTEIEELAKLIITEGDLDLGDSLPKATLKLCELVRILMSIMPEMHERIKTYGINSHLGSPSEKAWINLDKALDKAKQLGIEVEGELGL